MGCGDVKGRAWHETWCFSVERAPAHHLNLRSTSLWFYSVAHAPRAAAVDLGRWRVVFGRLSLLTPRHDARVNVRVINRLVFSAGVGDHTAPRRIVHVKATGRSSPTEHKQNKANITTMPLLLLPTRRCRARRRGGLRPRRHPGHHGVAGGGVFPVGYPDDAADGPLSRGDADGAPAALRHPRRQARRSQGTASILAALYGFALVVVIVVIVVVVVVPIDGDDGTPSEIWQKK